MISTLLYIYIYIMWIVKSGFEKNKLESNSDIDYDIKCILEQMDGWYIYSSTFHFQSPSLNMPPAKKTNNIFWKTNNVF